MKDNQQDLVSFVLMRLKKDNKVTEEKVNAIVDQTISLSGENFTRQERDEIIKEIHSCRTIVMDRGSCLKEDEHKSWYYAAKKNIDPKYWDRYSKYLFYDKHFSQNVIDTLDATTDEIMDMLGNPSAEQPFSRRGLVIGDVQSGKTSTYTALINKAVDAGYKIVILLTGTIEKLRQQTQERLDAGFIGKDSKAVVEHLKDKERVGVGCYNDHLPGLAFTTTVSDFTVNASKHLFGTLSGKGMPPSLFVLKKNKSVLEKLESWLDSTMDKNVPVLLVDDEADNASVNTKDDETNPTAINKCIRKILKIFNHCNYVAFTATPFANIFINPDSTTEMLSDDLFPRDFIYALEAPSNYVGARTVFVENAKHYHMIKNHDNDDCGIVLPQNHKKDDSMEDLPLSLQEAIASFFIVNAIRDLRGDTKSHRTMLINVSRFINVQNGITKLVDSFVREIYREILHYSKTDSALNHKHIKFLKDTFDTYYMALPENVRSAELWFSWDDICSILKESTASIVVKSVNGGNASKNLNYDEHEDEGLRIIAVGGFSLSRGLTLEGLCISYFYRNSKMYDTLMQMGRWFGYRPHYEDLCQVWMNDESVEWYSYISEASDELRREVRKMCNQGRIPKDFGLRVRSDINSLHVTALNKMRSSELIRDIAMSGDILETPYIYKSKEKNVANYNIVNNWLNTLQEDGYDFADNVKCDLALKNPQILNVPKERVLQLLSMYDVCPMNMEFRPDFICDYIRGQDNSLFDLWDVMIAQGSSPEATWFGIVSVKPVNRIFNIRNQALQLSAGGARLGSANLGQGGLTKLEREKIQQCAVELRPESKKKQSFSEEEYFNTGIPRNPLLVIYPIHLKPGSDVEKQIISKELDNIATGISIGVPSVDGIEAKTFSYRVNLVKLREMYGITEDDFVDETGLEE